MEKKPKASDLLTKVITAYSPKAPQKRASSDKPYKV